jgi:hypothetical protein
MPVQTPCASHDSKTKMTKPPLIQKTIWEIFCRPWCVSSLQPSHAKPLGWDFACWKLRIWTSLCRTVLCKAMGLHATLVFGDVGWLNDWMIDGIQRCFAEGLHNLTTFVFPLAGSMLCHLWEVPSITIIRSLDCASSSWLWHADCLQSQTWAEVHPKPGSQSSPRPVGAEQYVLNEHCEIPTAPAWDQTWRRQGLAIFKDYTCRWRPSQSCSVRRDA